jgi:hypothetical protein
MGIVLPFRPGKLTFPGTMPGINYAHPAAVNLVMSAIPGTPISPGFFNNLIVAAPFALRASGTLQVVYVIDSIVGPAFYNNVNGTQIQGIAGYATMPPVYTIASIFRVKVVAGAGSYQNITTFRGNAGLWLKSTGTALNPNIYIGSDNVFSITLTSGNAYFIAISGTPVAGNKFSAVVRSLSTGQIFSGSVTIGTSQTTDDSFMYVGEDGNEASFCAIATSMYSRTLLSMPQLLEWAGDPWSFWYPPNLDLADMLAVPPTVPVVPHGSTLPLMGVG